MRRMPRAVAALLLLIGPWAMGAQPLRFTPAGKAFRFDTGVLAGTLRQGGRSLGLTPVVFTDGKTPVAGRHGLVSHYRLLTADARFGNGAWDWASAARLLPDGAVESRWRADAVHPFHMTAVYRWAAPNALDVVTTVTAQKPLRRLEVFLASYFHGLADSFVYARDGEGAKPRFLPADKAKGVWQMFPRDPAAVKMIQDGRWKHPPSPVAWAIRPQLAAPLALRRDRKTGLVGLVMAPRSDCFAVATPFSGEGHRSLYLCLLGRDLKEGESAVLRARLVVGKGITDEQAVALHEAYVKELRQPTHE